MLHKADQIISDSDSAIRLLKDGNERYLTRKLCEKDSYYEDRKILKDRQVPFAAVLTCSDSRVAPEIFFDLKLGDIFTIRNAGNVIDQSVLGSIEYAVSQLKCPLVLVVGHSHCGAVTAAFEGKSGTEYLNPSLDQIKESIKSCKDLDQSIEAHTLKSAEKIRKDDIIKSYGTRVLSAIYDIETGRVSWLD